MTNYTVNISNDYTFTEKNITIGNSEKHVTIDYINKIRHNLQIPIIKNKFQYFEKLMFSLTKNSLFFNELLSDKNKSDYLNYLKAEIKSSSKYINNYFLNIFPKRLELFENITVLENCTQTKYEHNTLTGRLKVTEGTNYLTMKKEERCNLRHSDKKRTIYEIDFKSCEPNFYLKSQNIKFDDRDVYEHLKNKFKIDIPRDAVKRGILATLYGANTNTVASISKIKKEKIEKIKNYFQVKEFEKNLSAEFKKNGYFKNFYGRPLMSNNNLINHWIQSSTADYCILAFKNLLETKNDIEVHGVIHDAVVVSSSQKINFSSIKESISNIEIPVTIKKLSNI